MQAPKQPTPRARRYFTTAIPYVNASPHIGFAMELVLADVMARYRRRRGDDVRFVSGTDENSLKNVRAAEAEGVTTAELVERNAAAFRELRELLELSFDDFLRTSADPRHEPGVVRLWRACADRGDIYRRSYRGRYCVGCEQYYTELELDGGLCPEHRIRPELVEEDNYFFRLSRYQDTLRARIETGELRITPGSYRNEVLAFIDRGLQDFSISRSAERARGWGIGVPDDPDQVMFVWFDALGNYITALGYSDDGELLRRFWRDGGERVHFIGKGITRFHAIYWPAMLLSAGLELPTTIAVHGYLTVQGRKIGKSLGNAIAPADVVSRFGVDAVRYFLCRHVRAGRDGDFSASRVAAARASELADQLGNLLRRTISMIERYFAGVVPRPDARGSRFAELARDARRRYEAAMDDFRHDVALASVWSLIEEANRYVVECAPWRLARRRDAPGVESNLANVLYTLAELLRLVALLVEPFTPRTAATIRAQLGIAGDASSPWARASAWGQLAPGVRVALGPALFPKEAVSKRAGGAR